MSLSRTIATYLEHSTATTKDVEDVLSHYNVTSLLPEVLRILKSKQKKEKEKDIVAIESPFPLSDISIQAIKKLVDGEQSEHVLHINGELLAGFRARYKNVLHDGSAERIIKEFENLR